MHTPALSAIWTRQLYLEYDRICYHFKAKLQRPLIRINDSIRQLGSWDAAARILSISQTLILNSSWSQVLEVLKHEMAHQYVDEVFQAASAPHGELFKQACLKLNVATWAARATILGVENLPQVEQPWLSAEESAVLRRAQKLLALASSANPHEAEAAMRKVQYLYETYQLQSLEQLEIPAFTRRIINHKRRRMERYQSLIAALLVESFEVQVVHSSLFDALAAVEHKTLEIFGTAQQTEFAEYVYWFLYNNLPSYWRSSAQQKRSLLARNRFYEGVVAGFQDKMRHAKVESPLQQAGTARTRSLMRAQRSALDLFVRSSHPRLHTTKLRAQRGSASSYSAGFEKGRSLSLNRPLDKTQHERPRLLGR